MPLGATRRKGVVRQRANAFDEQAADGGDKKHQQQHIEQRAQETEDLSDPGEQAANGSRLIWFHAWTLVAALGWMLRSPFASD